MGHKHDSIDNDSNIQLISEQVAILFYNLTGGHPCNWIHDIRKAERDEEMRLRNGNGMRLRNGNGMKLRNGNGM